MASVDNRVVEMTFDNADFERRLSTTIQSLDKLNKKLDFDKPNKSIQGISSSIAKFNMGGMVGHVESVSKSFLALSTIALTALSQITKKALETGVNVAKSLSLDLVFDGFKEYETNINSIQTIMANTAAKGTTLEQVTDALNALNTYSDKTIYNFGQMAKSIGTFTAAGVDLKTSVASIKGIANLAAISGSSSEQAASAMYQLSQAIATGTLKLIDWNSVVNAGMGGEVFQKALFESGKAMKTLKGIPMDMTFEKWKKAGNSFRSSLEDGWLTTEVLTNTLKGFTGEMTEAQLTALGYSKAQAAEFLRLGATGVDAATKVRTLSGLIQTTKEAIGSGWSASFRILFGDFAEATTLFTALSGKISDAVQNSADSRNKILEGWDKLGGRTLLIDSLKNTFQALLDIVKPIKDAFREIFPKQTAESLFALTEKFNAFSKAIQPSKSTMATIKKLFEGFFGVVRIGIDVVVNTIQTLKNLWDAFSGSERVKAGVDAFADFIQKMQDTLIEGGKIRDFFHNLTDFIKDPMPVLEEFVGKIQEFFSGIKGMPDHLPGLDAFEGFFDRVGQRVDTVRGIGSKIADVFDRIVQAAEKVKDALQPVFDYIKNWFSDLGDRIAQVLKPGDFDKVLDVVNVGLLGGLTFILSRFLKNGVKLDLGSGFFKSMTSTFDELTNVLQAMQTNIKSNALLKIAAAIAILAGSLLVLSLIDSAALTRALTATTTSLGQLLVSMRLMTKFVVGPKDIAALVGMTTAMTILSGALLILSLAVRSFATMSWEELARGFAAVTAALTVMVGLSKTLSGNTIQMVAAGIALVGIATGLNILALAVLQFSNMGWEEMAQGLVGVTGALVGIGLAMQLMPLTLPITGAGLILVATALNILALAVKSFSELSWADMATGLVGVAGGLVIVGFAMHMMPITLPITAAGLILVGTALNIIALSMKSFAEMDWGEMARGLVGMGTSLAVLAVATTAMSGAIPGAIATTVIAFGLIVLSKAIKLFAAIKISELIKGLAGLAVSMLVIGGTAAVLSGAIPAMLALGAALLLIGAGFALFGAGALFAANAFLAFVTGLAALSEIGSDAMMIVQKNILVLIGMVPALVTAFADGVIEFAKTILNAAPVLIGMLGVLIGKLIDTAIELTPKLLEAVGKFITGALNLIKEKFPEYVEMVISLIIAVAEGIRNNIYRFVDAAGSIIVEFIDALGDQYVKIIDAGVDFIVKIIEGIAKGVVKFATATLDIMVEFIVAMRKAIDRYLPKFQKEGARLLGAIVNGFTFGIAGKAKELADKAVDMFSAAKDAVFDWFGVGSPSKVFNQLGKWVVEGFTNALDADTTAERSMTNLSKKTVDAFQNAMALIPPKLDALDDFNPTITPVLNLSNIEKDASQIGTMLGKQGVQYSFGQAQAISRSTLGRPLVPEPTTSAVTEVKFEQTINAPKELTTADIYKKTRNLLSLAKTELSIP